VIVEGRSVPAGSELRADLCIIGAGAAGITVALALADRNISIIVLESGGPEPGGASQELAGGDSIGQQYAPLESARLRCLGGSTMHWGGWCRPLDAIDFERRAWVPHSGWPITRAALDAYYPRAQQICELGDFAYDPADWLLPDGSVLPLGGRVQTRLIQFSPPTRFGVRYRESLAKAGATTVYLNSTVVRLQAAANARSLDRVHVRTLAGNRFEVRARRYVLAAGGIDNPRLLLASNQVVPAGIGNEHDLVGRFFTDHIQLDTAGLRPAPQAENLDLYQPSSRETIRRTRRAGGRSAGVMAYLALDPLVQESRGTVNYGANLLQTTWSDYVLEQDATGSSPSAVQWDIGQSLANLWHELDVAVETAVGLRGKLGLMFKIVTTQEQAPNPLSRVTLSTERDAIGMPRPVLDWRLTDLDRHSITVAVDELARAFGGAHRGTLYAPLDLAQRGWPADIPISWHHGGTTRMSAEPSQGVVDAEGRVHGMENLYVAGSSVFPTNGSGNPTLTIVALALRLADHLKEQLR